MNNFVQAFLLLVHQDLQMCHLAWQE